MLSVAFRSKWLIATFVVDTLIDLLKFLSATVVISFAACFIWVYAFLIDIILMKSIRNDYNLKDHEMRYSFAGCQYEVFVIYIRDNICLYLTCDPADNIVTADSTAEALEWLLPANRYLDPRGVSPPSSSILFVWRLWETILQFAFQTPHDHVNQEKLVNLIVALSKRPAVLVRYQDTLMRFWDAMPHYDIFVTWYGNLFFFDPNWRHSDETTHRTSLMAFIARVQATGLPYGLMFGANWSLHTALDTQRLDILPWASFWIEHCGEYLWWYVSQESNNGVIFTKAVWTHYMRQFHNMACDGRNARYVRKLVQNAFSTMARLTDSVPNPKFDNIGQRQWEAILAEKGPEGEFEEPIAPDLWDDEDSDLESWSEEEEEDEAWVWDGESYSPATNAQGSRSFHPLRPLGGFLMYSNVSEEDESVIARAA